MKVLIIDNYDSFVYNLYQEIGEIGADPLVYRNDGITMKEVRQLAPDAIVLSPGPGHPANARDFGVCRDILEELSPATPTLGVCLGHQGVGTAYGGEVGDWGRIVPGKTGLFRPQGRTIYGGLSPALTDCMY